MTLIPKGTASQQNMADLIRTNEGLEQDRNRLKEELEQATLLTAALQELIDTEWRPIKNRLEDKVEKLQQDNERLKEELEHMTEHKKGHAITIRELQQEVERLTAELEGYKDA